MAADVVEPVFAWWDNVNKQHTFHMPPAWKHPAETGVEELQQVQVFSTYKEEHEGTMPVYDWWDDANKQHTFHFEPAWDGETKGNIAFYAFNETENPNLEPVYDYWDNVNKQHTFHMPPVWANEVQNAIQFYAYRDDAAASPPTPEPTPDPTPAPPAVPPVSRSFGFTSSSAIANTEAFLEKCTQQLAAHGVTCDSVSENEGIIQVDVTGPPAAMEILEQASGWEDVDLEELAALQEDWTPPAAGDNLENAPQIGAKTVNNATSQDADSGSSCGLQSIVALSCYFVYSLVY